MRVKVNELLLEKVKGIVSYLYGIDFANAILDGGNIEVEVSRSTGRVKHVFVDGVMVLTLRASDGYLLPTIDGMKKVLERLGPQYYVKVRRDAAEYIARGRSVFTKHVIEVDPRVRAGMEVMVVDENCRLIAVGRALLSAKEIKDGVAGVCVKVRRGILE